MANRIQIRRGNAATWVLVNPVLSDGEIGWERDTNIFKVGNGTDTWGDLPPANTTNLTITDIIGLTDALDAKVEFSDISNFETTTQLNSRDTANRSRSNHTGTQEISTVTGLQTALDDKAPASHNHTASQITDFATEVNILIAANGKGLTLVAVPETPTSAGTSGDFATDSGFFYLCTATNTWIRLPRDTSTWDNS